MLLKIYLTVITFTPFLANCGEVAALFTLPS
jgi:hypothetical protein